MAHFRKSSDTKREFFDGKHRFEHWYRDNTLYFITSKVRDGLHTFQPDRGMDRRLYVVLMALMLVIGGCAGPWKPIAGDVTPWSGPHEPASKVGRVLRRPFFVIAAPDAVLDVRWEDSRGSKSEPRKIVEQSESYLNSVGAMAPWPQTGTYNGSVSNGKSNGVQEKLAPFNFTIVAIDPIVVLMTTRPSAGSVDSDRMAMMSETNVNSLQGRWLLNAFRYGPHATGGKPVFWFSPDLKQGPFPLEATDSPSIGIIRLPDGILKVEPDQSGWQIIRQ